MFNIFKKKNKQNPKSPFMEKLERSGYFEFTDDLNLKDVKNKIQKGYDQFGVFITALESNYTPMCKKVFFCDSETLYEDWGYKTQLKNMQEGLERVTNFDELISKLPESYEYQSISNGKWSEAVIDFTSRVNNQLTTTGSTYRCYPAYGGNEGSMYILNEGQFNFLNKVIQDDHTRPLSLKTWKFMYASDTSAPKTPQVESNHELKVGINVKHMKFGTGKIIEICDRRVATIRFISGEKRIMNKYANLEVVQ